MTGPAPLAEVTRTDLTAAAVEVVESRHVGHLVVTGSDGEVVDAIGDPQRVTFVRSTSKPFQATASLELLGERASSLSGEELAVSWASHRAEPHHVAAVRRLLGRSGTAADALTCPASTAEDDPGATPARILHNCSGKHAMFALAGQAQGTPREELLTLDGPLQRVVSETLADALGPAVAVGVDGCGAPAVAVPLARLAAAYAALATDDRWRRVREAGLAHPQLVGGRGRLESALLAAGVVAKIGAEGVFAAGWRGPDGSPRGLAVKAEDGAERAATVAAHAALVAAGAVDADVWAPAPVLGGGRPVGRVRPTPPVESGTG